MSCKHSYIRNIIKRVCRKEIKESCKSIKNVGNGIWYYRSDNFEGYFVDTDIHKELKYYNIEIFVNSSSKLKRDYEQHYAFIHDRCGMAAVEETNEGIIKNIYILSGSEISFEKWEKQRRMKNRAELMSVESMS